MLPDGDGLSPSAFKGFLATKGVMDPFLVERLFRAIDENQNGEVICALLSGRISCCPEIGTSLVPVVEMSALTSIVAELQFQSLACGQITFAEFKRAVQLLKGTLEQRLGH